MTRVYVILEEGEDVGLGYRAINVDMVNVNELETRLRVAPEHGGLSILLLGKSPSISARTCKALAVF